MLVTLAYSQDAEDDARNLGTVSFVRDTADGEDVTASDGAEAEQGFTIDQTIHVTAVGAHGTLGEPDWDDRITRTQVGSMIGQPFPDVPSATSSRAQSAEESSS